MSERALSREQNKRVIRQWQWIRHDVSLTAWLERCRTRMLYGYNAQ